MSDAAHSHFVEGFAAFADARAAGEPGWLAQLRRESIELFEASGLPTTKQEDWRHTNISRIARQKFSAAMPGQASLSRERVEALAFPLYACSLFVFVNGHRVPSLSTPSGLARRLHVESLAELRAGDGALLEGQLGRLTQTKQNAFAALGTAYCDDGAVIVVPAGESIDEPIHLVFASTGTGDGAALATHPRVLIVAEAGSHVTVVQDHVSVGTQERLTNAVTEISVGANAAVDYVLLQRECDASFAVTNLDAEIGRDGRLNCHTLTLGGALVRNDLRVTLADTGAETRLNGLFLATGTRHIDNHTHVDHAMPHGTSRELYKGILRDKARGVFRGRVLVRPDAQHTDAQQSNPNLLLSDGAEINTKPQLEIRADDVKCSHGSTIGQIDLDALFYLRSRGLAKDDARALLTRGFASEITRALPAEALGERVQELILEQLEGRGEGDAQ